MTFLARPLLASALIGVGIVGASHFVGCATTTHDFPATGADGGDPMNEGGMPAMDSGPVVLDDAGLPVGVTRDPADCNEAKTSHSYVGCDYWPTVVANPVWSIFDYAVGVSNTGTMDASVTVTGPNGVNKTTVVPAGQLKKIYLPWVPELKGPDMDECAVVQNPMSESVIKAGGAYHLVSTSPVIVYQFSALEYKGQGGEAPDGGVKDWSACPGTTTVCATQAPPAAVGCFAYTTDASLLLPSTALTGNYRIAGEHGWTGIGPGGVDEDLNSTYFAVTATMDGTSVTVKPSPSGGAVLAGTGFSAGPGGTLVFTLNAGDVAEVLAARGQANDLSGSLVQATHPVQVISGVPCLALPKGASACDHLESSVFPAETLGKHYVVTVPTSPLGNVVGHYVRLYGNVDATNLTYVPSRPPACPVTLVAGQMVDCGIVDHDFEVTGDHEFTVGSFMLSAEKVDPSPPAGQKAKGDPSSTFFPGVEQFRTKYLFLAPPDYDVSYADIVGTSDAAIVIDGVPVSVPFGAITGSAFGVYRVPLGAGQGGAHTITAAKAVGVQVIGYGAKTSYEYPGGLNLNLIAPPPK